MNLEVPTRIRPSVASDDGDVATFAAPGVSLKKPSVEQEVRGSVEQRLRQCPYAFVFCKVRFLFENGRLTLRGCVPSFYLKQILQERLRGIEHVKQIENEVDVVSSTGVSSVRLQKPR
jgi:hypothetical protein